MLWQNFGEYLYFFSISGFLFCFFFLLLTIFGYIFFNVIIRRILRIKHKLGLLETSFLSFGIGFVIYISLSFILLYFEIFDFFLAYLPLVLIDSFYVIYLYLHKKTKLNLREFYNKKILGSKKLIYFCTFFISILFLFSLQIILQFQDITKYTELMFKDSYYNLENIYYLLDNNTVDINGSSPYFYPPGFFIFCSGALQISNNYLVAFFFLKFGGVFLLSLFMLNIFQLTLKLFRKFSISIICSLLLLSYYLSVMRITAFLSGSFAVFVIGISINIFFKEKKFLYLIGFFIPLVYFLNPGVFLYYLILLSCYVIFLLFFLDRKSFKFYLGVVLNSFLILFCLILPYLLLLSNYNLSLFDLLKVYTNYILWSGKPFLINVIKTLVSVYESVFVFFQETTGIIQNLMDFLLNGSLFKEFNVAFNTIVIFIIFLCFGMIMKSSKIKKDGKFVLTICKVAVLIILAIYSYLILFSFILNLNVPILLHTDRIFLVYFPFIIILCGFGLSCLMKLIDRIIKHSKNRQICVKRILKNIRFYQFIIKWKENVIKSHRNSNLHIKMFRLKIKNIKSNSKNVIKFKRIFGFLLVSLIIANLLSQTELKEEFRRHYYDNYTINSYLTIKTYIPNNSTILMPNFTHKVYLINRILNDVNITIINNKISQSFLEFDLFVKNNSFNYIFLNKTASLPIIKGIESLFRVIKQSIILKNLPISTDYTIIFENEQYILYEVRYFP